MNKIFTRIMASLLLVCMLATFIVPATFADTDSSTVISYNFAIYDDPVLKAVVLKNGTSFRDLDYTATSHHGCGKTAQNCIKECFYDADQTNWYLEGSSAMESVEIRANAGHQEGSRINATAAGQWVAFRLKISQTGKYDVVFNSNSGSYGAEAYMFPASALTGGKTVESLMTPENKMNNVVFNAAAKGFDAQLGEIEVASAGEHIVVFRATGTRLYFNGLTLTKTGDISVPQTSEATTTGETGPAVGTVAQTWDFILYNAEQDRGYNAMFMKNGVLTRMHYGSTCNCGCRKTIQAHLADAYDDLKWMYVERTDSIGTDGLYFRSEGAWGLRVKAANDTGWSAYKLKVDQAGTYSLRHTPAVKNSGTYKAYIFTSAELEATANGTVAELMGASNASSHCVGQIAVSSANLSADFNAYHFADAGEYIVVFEHIDTGFLFLGELALVVADSGSVPETSEPEITTTPVISTAPETTTTPETTAPVVQGENFWNFRFYQIPGYENVANMSSYSTLNADCRCGMSHKIIDHLNTSYPELGWKIAGTSAGTVSGISARCAENRGLGLKIEASNWVGITLKVTASGMQELITTGNTTQTGFVAYLFPGALTEEQIGDQMADRNAVAGNLIKSGVIPAAEPSSMGVYDFTAGEYTLVIYNTNNRLRTMYLGSIALQEYQGEAPTEPAVPETSVPEAPFVPAESYWDLEVYKTFTNLVPDGSKLTPMDTCSCGAGHTIKEHIDSAYSQLGWKFAGASTADMSTVTIRQQDDRGIRMSPEAQGWVGFNLNVTQSGKCDIYVIGRGSQQDGIYGYIFEGALTAEQIAEKMADTAAIAKNSLGIPVKGAKTPSVIGSWNFNTGEYTLVLRNARQDKARTVHISGIGLLGEKPVPVVDKKVYNFNLMKDDPTLEKKGPTSRYNADGTIRTNQHIESLYNNNTIDWKFETQSKAWQASTASFRAGCFRFKSTENYRDVADQWFAFRIENPGTAKYDIRLTTSGAGMMVANVYLIPATSPLTMSEAKIKEAMIEENLLVKGAIIDKKDTFYLGDYTFGMEEEYLLVFEFTKGTILYLNEITMTKDGLVADGTIKKDVTYNGFVYDFDMGDSLNGYYTKSKTMMGDVLSDLNNMWSNGTLKWKWETSSSGKEPGNLHRFYRVGGMRFFHKENAWVAVRIKSPGSGTYTLTMNHALMISGGTTAVYILPGDTEDIEFAMDPKNRVGKVAMYNDGINPNVEDGKTAFVGYWDFEAGKEYIMVFESYKASPYSDDSYVNISQVIAQKGKIDYTTTEDKQVDSVMVQENVVPVADALSSCVVTEIYGHDYFFLPIEGGAMLVYDLDTRELVDTVTTGYARTLDIQQDKDGNIWISGSAKYMVRYNPYTKETFRTLAFTKVDWMSNYSGANSICTASDGKIWFGTYYSSILCVYDPQTDTYRKVGKVADRNISKIHGIMEHNGFLYMTTEAGDAETSIVKFDLATEKVVGSVDTTHMMGTAGYLATLSMLGDGDLLVAGVSSNKLDGFVAVNPETMELVEVEGIFGYMGMYASEVIDGKQYVVSNGYGLYEYDLATKTFSKVPGFGNQGIGFRSTANSLVTIDGQKCLFTYTTSGGHPRYFAMEDKEYKTWDDLVVHGSGGAGIRNVTAGPDDGRLYIGVFNSDQGGIYDVNQGKLTGYYKTGGQGDSQIWYEGKFYGGNYSSTTLNEVVITDYNATRPATNEVIQRWRLDHEETGQKRVHELAAGDGYIFAGTIPDTGEYGGAVTVYDTKTGRWYTHRNVVQDCAVTGLEYYDKLLYGVTSTSGGTGTTAAKPAGSSAKIFVYDYENREVVATMDPRDYIKGLPSPVAFIGGFGQDPVVEGRFWAVVSETLFCFTFDKEAKTFQVQEVISFDKSAYDASAAKHMWSKRVLFDTERNYIYYSFDANGGFQCIELADWNAPVGSVKVKTHSRIMGDAPQFYDLGADGELYYGNQAHLYMLPLNVTDEDWQIAGAVDKMITDLGEVTLEKEADIKSARSAYDNLSWRYKALTQKLELLQESETDLLECKIDAVVLEEVDADSLPELQEYVDTYNGFNARQKKYTKNYAYLLEAYAKATALNDERVAAAMQKRMDDLGKKFPLTLEDEPEVLQLRADYDALTGPQRALVDAKNLEEAEAQIKVLRAEFVKYVEQLIQKIPDQITLAAEEVIVAAREAADKLYVNERKEVSYSKLTSAEGKLRTLKRAKAAAEEVDALIDAIGIVTLGDKDRIAEAREAYDALNGTAMTFLQKGKKLETAEFILKALQTWGIPAITVANAGIVFAVLWFVPSLHSKVFKTKKKEEEVIDN